MTAKLLHHNVSRRAQEIIMMALRKSSQKQYASYIAQWAKFCDSEDYILNPPIHVVLNFLTSLVDKGLGYSTICTARAAVGHIATLCDTPHSITTHPWIIKFIKGVFNIKPAAPRYHETWDVHSVLQFLRKQSPNEDLSLLKLSQKAVMLTLLVTAGRGQDIILLDLNHIHNHEGGLTCLLAGLTKTTRPGSLRRQLNIPAYPIDLSVCPVQCLQEYLTRTRYLRPEGVTSLFITSTKPYGPASRDTISRWVKTLMHDAGIDTAVYRPHSTRAASTSAARRKNTPLPDILKAAGWKSERTFQIFYNKPLPQGDFTFGKAILQD